MHTAAPPESIRTSLNIHALPSTKIWWISSNTAYTTVNIKDINGLNFKVVAPSAKLNSRHRPQNSNACAVFRIKCELTLIPNRSYNHFMQESDDSEDFTAGWADSIKIVIIQATTNIHESTIRNFLLLLILLLHRIDKIHYIPCRIEIYSADTLALNKIAVFIYNG